MRSALAFSEMEVSFAGAGLRAFGCQQNANRMPTEKSLDAMTDCRDTMVILRVQSLLHAVRDRAFQILMGFLRPLFTPAGHLYRSHYPLP